MENSDDPLGSNAKLYEVNRHKKDLEALVERLKAAIDSDSLEGLLVVRIPKGTNPEIDMVFGGASQYEWIGFIEYIKDMVKEF